MATQNSPYFVDAEAGKNIAICNCGLSQNLPLCDGSHKAEGVHSPTIVSVDEARTLVICGCRKSGNLPYCDGTHSRV